MSKGLDMFNNYILSRLKQSDITFLDVRNAIYQVEKELKVIEFVKTLIKSLGLTFIFMDDKKEIFIIDDNEYEHSYMCKSQEEYDLLKEVLK